MRTYCLYVCKGLSENYYFVPSQCCCLCRIRPSVRPFCERACKHPSSELPSRNCDSRNGFAVCTSSQKESLTSWLSKKKGLAEYRAVQSKKKELAEYRAVQSRLPHPFETTRPMRPSEPVFRTGSTIMSNVRSPNITTAYTIKNTSTPQKYARLRGHLTLVGGEL